MAMQAAASKVSWSCELWRTILTSAEANRGALLELLNPVHGAFGRADEIELHAMERQTGLTDKGEFVLTSCMHVCRPSYDGNGIWFSNQLGTRAAELQQSADRDRPSLSFTMDSGRFPNFVKHK
jgi:hypothetical protein